MDIWDHLIQQLFQWLDKEGVQISLLGKHLIKLGYSN